MENNDSLWTSLFGPFIRYFSALFETSPRFPRHPRSDQLRAIPSAIVCGKAIKRQVPCQLLFIGESGSGKSAIIRNIFKVKPPNSENDPLGSDNGKQFEVWDLPTTSESTSSIQVEILNVPSLLGKNSIEQDAEILIALSSLMKKESRSRLPTVTFIVARMDDNRFEGEQSNFSRVLKSFTHIRSYLTDKICSNVILLLTNSDKAEVQENASFIIERYQNAFEQIFKLAPVPCIPINRHFEYHHLIKELSQIASKSGRRECDLLHGLVNDIDIPSRFCNGFNLQRLPVEELLPPRKALITKIVNKLLNSEVGDGDNVDLDDNDENDSSKFYPYFRPYPWIDSPRQKGQKTQVYTCLSGNSKVTLADKSSINVADCLVGDRVLSFRSKIGVITNVIKVLNPYDPWLSATKLHRVGRIHCEVFSEVTTGKPGQNFVYFYQQDSFRLLNSKNIVNIDKPFENMYYLEVDGGEGSFIVDGYVCICND